MAHAHIYRGTGEEIAQTAHLYRERTDLTLIVPIQDDPTAPLSDKEKEAALTSDVPGKNVSTKDPFLVILQEIVERTSKITSQPDTLDWLREGRSGGMFGYAPTE